MRRADPSAEVVVFERNRPDDTFGFGVVFSDRTLEGIHEADPVLRQALESHGRHWDEIEVRLKGPWGASILAPDGEGGLPMAEERLARIAAAGPVLAAVYGGTPLTRTLLCEHVRLRLGLPALLIDPGLGRDQAVTAVLSGRADLVGVPAATAVAWERG